MHLLRTGRNVTIIALILSLLFHASTVLYIFLQKTHNNFFSQSTPNNLDTTVNHQQQEQQKQTPWVETKARAGNFGAPVFFEDEPEQTNHDETQQELLEEKNITDTQQDHPEIATPPQVEERKPVQTRMPNANTVEKPLEPRVATKKTQEPAQHRTPKPKALPKKNAVQQKNPFTNYPTPQNHPKPPLTLAQLTQGFLNQQKKDSGSYGISMLGRKSGIPSDEQMKYERYLQKLSYCLDNSFHIHTYNRPQISDDTDIYLFFQLNRDGILEHLSVKKSSGSTILDNFVVFVFRQASQSFPPVPSYLPDNPFRMNYVISIRRIAY